MFKSKSDNFFPLSLIVFVLLEILLVYLGQFQIGILLYLVYAFILYSADKIYIVSLFVYYLPLLPIIPTDYKLFSLLGPHEIIYGFAFFVLSDMVKRKKKIKLNKYQKLSINFIYFLFFIQMYVMVKDILIGLNPDKTKGLLYIVKNLVRYFLYYQSLVLLIKVIYTEGIFNHIVTGIKYAIVTIPISMIFTKPLIAMGANVYFAATNKEEILTGEYQRFVGFYGAGGDENSAGIFLAGAFGFLMALYEKEGKIKKYLIFMGFAVLGVLLTGSRTAFIGLALVILIFMITNKSGGDKFSILIACIVFYFIFAKQLNLLIQRFVDPSAVAAIDPNSEDKGRVWKWVFYTNWLLENPITFLFGNQKKINLFYAPHNYFIYVAYHAGLIPLLVYFNLFVKLVKSIKFTSAKYALKNAYYIIPFPFIAMSVNSFGSSIYLWIFLPMGLLLITD